jgi:hypothetical protein
MEDKEVNTLWKDDKSRNRDIIAGLYDLMEKPCMKTLADRLGIKPWIVSKAVRENREARSAKRTNLEALLENGEDRLAEILAATSRTHRCEGCIGGQICEQINWMRYKNNGKNSIQDSDDFDWTGFYYGRLWFYKNHCTLMMKMWLRSPEGTFVIDKELISWPTKS